MKRFKVIKEFLELHNGNLHLRRKHLTDAEVAAFQKQDPESFSKYFEEVSASATDQGKQEGEGKSKNKK